MQALLFWTALASVLCACSASTQNCTNPHLKLVSQTAVGTSVSEIAQQDGSKTVVAHIRQNISMAIDYDSFSFNNFISQIVTIEDSNMTALANEVGVILNAHNRTYTILTRDPQNSHQECVTFQIPAFVPLSIIARATRLWPYMYKCKGHHDDVDSFESALNFPPAFLPIKLPVDLKFEGTVETDAGGLLRSERIEEEFSAGHLRVKMTMNQTMSESRAGGPSVDDLAVPESWGKCKIVEAPAPETLLNEWLNSNTQSLGHLRLIPHAIRAMISDSSNTVIV